MIPATPKTVSLSPSLVEAKEKATVAPDVAREEIARKAGSDFATTWAGRAAPEEIEELLRLCPRIPMPLDFQLISEAEKSLGSLRENQDLKKSVRKGFWDKIKSH